MEQNSIHINEALFAKYLAKECNNAESNALNQWLEQKPENQLDFDIYAQLWNLSKNDAPQFDVDDAWKEVDLKSDHLDQRTGIYDQEGRILTLDTEEPVKKNYYSWIGMVVILILLGIGLWFQSTLKPESNKPDYAELSVLDEKQDVNLKDGSKVTLAENATFKYFETVKGDTREVWLTGKAFFEVAADNKKPFIVHTPLSDITGRDMAFGVDANYSTVIVNVAEGIISVKNNNSLNAMKVMKDQSAIVSDEMAEIMVDLAADPEAFYWKDHTIRFKDTSLGNAMRILKTNMDIDIELENESLAFCELTATFKNESKEKVIEMIVTQLGLAYEKEGEVFIISGRGC